MYALFSNSGGLKQGSSVVIAGVEVGRIRSVDLDDYQARIVMNLNEEVKLQEDAIAAIKTKGLIGEKLDLQILLPDPPLQHPSLILLKRQCLSLRQ